MHLLIKNQAHCFKIEAQVTAQTCSTHSDQPTAVIWKARVPRKRRRSAHKHQQQHTGLTTGDMPETYETKFT